MSALGLALTLWALATLGWRNCEGRMRLTVEEAAVRVALSQSGGALTVQVVKSAGEGVTMTLPEPPATGADPEAALRVTAPTAPACVTV